MFQPVELDLATLHTQRHRRFVKTHLPFDAVPIWDEVKYIHVSDGRDRGAIALRYTGVYPQMVRALVAIEGLESLASHAGRARWPAGGAHFGLDPT